MENIQSKPLAMPYAPSPTLLTCTPYLATAIDPELLTDKAQQAVQPALRVDDLYAFAPLDAIPSNIMRNNTHASVLRKVPSPWFT